jgi:hypothetical protein
MWPKSLGLLSDQALLKGPVLHDGMKLMKAQLRNDAVLRPTQGNTKVLNLKLLLEAALSENASVESSPASSKENYSRQNGDPEITEKEAKQLRAIKRIMEVKGVDALMKFLES